jgi:hypothetical protein
MLAAGVRVCLFYLKKGGCNNVNLFVGFIVMKGEVIIVFDVQCLM